MFGKKRFRTNYIDTMEMIKTIRKNYHSLDTEYQNEFKNSQEDKLKVRQIKHDLNVIVNNYDFYKDNILDYLTEMLKMVKSDGNE